MKKLLGLALLSLGFNSYAGLLNGEVEQLISCPINTLDFWVFDGENPGMGCEFVTLLTTSTAPVPTMVVADVNNGDLNTLGPETFERLVYEAFDETDSLSVTLDVAKHYDVEPKVIVEATIELYHSSEVNLTNMNKYIDSLEE